MLLLYQKTFLWYYINTNLRCGARTVSRLPARESRCRLERPWKHSAATVSIRQLARLQNIFCICIFGLTHYKIQIQMISPTKRSYVYICVLQNILMYFLSKRLNRGTLKPRAGREVWRPSGEVCSSGFLREEESVSSARGWRHRWEPGCQFCSWEKMFSLSFAFIFFPEKSVKAQTKNCHQK